MLSTLHLRKNFDARFAAVAGRIYVNRALSAADRDVFGVIALCDGGKLDWVEITQAEISEFLGVSERSVKRSIARLVVAGELRVQRQKYAGNQYRVSNPATGRQNQQDQGAPAAVVGGKFCPRCSRSVRAVGKSGVCRSCAENERLVGRVAVARQELGAAATAEQLAAHLKNERLAARIRRLLRPAA